MNKIHAGIEMSLNSAFGQLSMLAEISTTLLGFIAVFLVLSKGDGRFEEADRHFIMGLVLSAVMIVILALTPQVLHLYDLAADVWPVALTVAVMFGSISAVYQARVQSKMTREEALKIHWGWHVGAWSLAAVSALFIVSGLAGFMKAEAAYVTAVSIMLVVGLWCFVGVVFRRFF